MENGKKMIEQSSESYQKIILNIRQDRDFILVRSKYSDECFGNFFIEIKYKETIKIGILNDRSRIEIDLLLTEGLLKNRIPLAFVVEVFSLNQSESVKYVYDSSEDTYDYLIQHKDVLEAIMEKRLQKTIIHKWKKKHF